MAQWKQYSGMWTLQQQLQAQGVNNWNNPTPSSATNVTQGLFISGDNGNGQLGQGNTLSSTIPLQVGNQTTWTTVSMGNRYVCAVKTDGALWGWGKNDAGQLGNGDQADVSSPIQIGALTNWRSIICGSDASFSTKNDNTLWAWGSGRYGQLGDITTIYKSSPIQIGALTNWTPNISNFGLVVGAIKSDNTLWMWGSNGNGSLGINLNYLANRSSPIQVGALSNWRTISVGGGVIATKTDGTIWAWGDNGSGQSGQQNTINKSSPVQIGTDTDWKVAQMGGNGWAFAMRTNNTIWAWGGNQYGQLGLNDINKRSSPTQIGALTNWAYISAGDLYAIAIKNNGTIWVWGNNAGGRLGLGTTELKSSPVQLGTFSTWYTPYSSSVASGFIAIKSAA